MTTLRPGTPICYFCKHFNTTSYNNLNKTACDAFPHQIPDEIFKGFFDHRFPYPNDGGIQFERYESYKDLPSYLHIHSEEALIREMEQSFADIPKMIASRENLLAKTPIIFHERPQRGYIFKILAWLGKFFT